MRSWIHLPLLRQLLRFQRRVSLKIYRSSTKRRALEWITSPSTPSPASQRQTKIPNPQEPVVSPAEDAAAPPKSKTKTRSPTVAVPALDQPLFNPRTSPQIPKQQIRSP